MSDAGYIIVNLIIFVLSLGILVCLHELGHFAFAKLFGVYVDEFSIGMGPLIYQHKPKGNNKKGQPKETKFSLRWVPLGGYCAMAGEEMDDIQGEPDLEKLKSLPKERFLNGIAKWKKAIIMVAGVTVNFILGFLILLVFFASTPDIDYRKTQLNVSDSVSYTVYTSLDNSYTYTENDILKTAKGIGLTENNVKKITISYSGETANTLVSNENPTTYEFNIYKGTVNSLDGYTAFTVSAANNIIPVNENDTKTYSFLLTNGETKEITVGTYYTKTTKTLEDNTTKDELTLDWKKIGISPKFTYSNSSFGEVMDITNYSFGQYSVLIFTSIPKIFTKQGFEQSSGLIGIASAQINISKVGGFNYVMKLWGMISINLAIVNILPFPGLDGWHLLVTAIEAITRKKVPSKFQQIMSTIGMVLLVGLFVIFIIKDIVSLATPKAAMLLWKKLI